LLDSSILKKKRSIFLWNPSKTTKASSFTSVCLFVALTISFIISLSSTSIIFTATAVSSWSKFLCKKIILLVWHPFTIWKSDNVNFFPTRFTFLATIVIPLFRAASFLCSFCDVIVFEISSLTGFLFRKSRTFSLKIALCSLPSEFDKSLTSSLHGSRPR